MQPFFAISDEIKLFVKEPYPKYEERPPDKWLLFSNIYTF